MATKPAPATSPSRSNSLDAGGAVLRALARSPHYNENLHHLDEIQPVPPLDINAQAQAESLYHLLVVKWEIPRKIFHATPGFVVLWLYWSRADLDKIVQVLFYMFLIISTADLLRLNSTGFEQIYESVLGVLMRNGEKVGEATTTNIAGACERRHLVSHWCYGELASFPRGHCVRIDHYFVLVRSVCIYVRSFVWKTHTVATFAPLCSTQVSGRLCCCHYYGDICCLSFLGNKYRTAWRAFLRSLLDSWWTCSIRDVPYAGRSAYWMAWIFSRLSISRCQCGRPHEGSAAVPCPCHSPCCHVHFMRSYCGCDRSARNGRSR